ANQLVEIGKTLLHLEILRQASLTREETANQRRDNALNYGILTDTKYPILLTSMKKQFQKMVRNVKDRDARNNLRLQITNGRKFPRIVAEDWFPAWYE
ncbi:MAG: hypothetical protein JKY54_18190, partial [Flavobacteriales bacterium]|nr:hypothetical protein [Flavobacteriales bacterium]